MLRSKPSLVGTLRTFLTIIFALTVAISASATCGGPNPSTITFNPVVPASTTAFGQVVTFSVNVADTSGLFGSSPTGTVQFFADGSPLGAPATLTANGDNINSTASLSTSTLSFTAPNPHLITAHYNGDANYACASIDDTFNGDGTAIFQTITMGASATAVTLTAGTNPSTLGSSVTFTVTVADASGTSGTAPTGAVLISDGTALIGGGTITDTGDHIHSAATFPTSILATGSHSITAVYGGDANFGGSNSAGSPLAQTVSPRAVTTAISLITSTVPVRTGSTAVTVTVMDNSANNSGTFSATTNNLNTRRSQHAASLLPNGQALIVGGIDNTSTVQSSAEIYDSVAGTFTTLGVTLNTPRQGATATLLQNGQVLIVGGSTTTDPSGAVTSAEIYDPPTNTFAPIAGALNTPRAGHTATLLPNGDVLIVGGSNVANGAPINPGTTELFTPGANPVATGAFAVGTPVLTNPRYQHTATLLRNGLILIVGGDGNNDTELINPANLATTTSGTTNVVRSGHAAVLLPDGNVLIAGGNTPAPAITNSVELYDQYTGIFFNDPTGAMVANGRFAFTATLLNNATVLAAGGVDNGSSTLGTAELYAPSYDPQGTISLSSGEAAGVDTLTGCFLTLSGNGTAVCPAHVTANHVGSGSHSITGNYIEDWSASTGFSPNTLIVPTNNADNPGGFLFFTTGGTSGASEPMFNQTIFGPTIDGTATWTNVGLSNHATGQASAPQSLTVQQQAITISPASDTKTYDGTTNSSGTPTISSGGLLGSDTFTNPLTQQFLSKSVMGANLSTLTVVTPITFSDPTDSSDSTADYSVATTTSSGTINALGITETVTAANKPYDQTATVTITNCTPVGVIGGDTVTCTAGAASFPSKAAGMNLTVTATGITLGGADGGNYTPTATETTTANISALAITETVAAANKTYDQTATAMITNCSPVGVIAGDTVTCSAGSASFPSKAAGNNLTVTATGITLGGADGTNYAATATETTTATINQLSITEAVTAANKTYDQTNVATINTCTPNSVIAGDVVTCSAAAATFPSKAAGNNLTVTATGITLGGADGTNYAPTATETTTATINQLSITEAVTAANKTYDRTATATINSCTPNSVIAGDVVTCSAAGATFPSKAAGNNLTVTATGITLSGADGTNYAATATETTTATINQLSITEAVTAANKTYDQTNVATINTCTPNSVIAGDVVTCSSAAATFPAKTVGNNLTVTATGITLGGADGTNYAPTATETATANITQLGITETVAASSKIYDATATATITNCSPVGVFGGDTVTCTTGSASFPSKNAGASLTVTASGITLSGADGPNYSPTATETTSATISQKSINEAGLSVAASKQYDGTLSAIVSGIPALQVENVGTGSSVDGKSYLGDSVSLAGAATGTYNSPNVATAGSVTFGGLVLAGADAPNYSLVSQPSQAATITPAPLSVSPAAASKVYGTANPAFTFSLAGFVNGETQGSAGVTGTPTLSSAATTASTVPGPYPITVSSAGTLAAPNYNFPAGSFGTANLTVTDATLNVTANNLAKTYGQTLAFAGTEFSQTGLLSANGDTLTAVTLSSSGSAANAAVAGGPYPITPSAPLTGTGLTNYSAAFANGSLTVNKAPLTVTPNNKTSVYGAALPVLDGTVATLVAGDQITGQFTTTATPASNAGVYPITVAGLVDNASRAGNYTIVNNGGTLTIGPAPSQVGAVAITAVANATGTPQFAMSASVANANAGSAGNAPGGNLIFQDCISGTCTQLAKVALAGGSATTGTLTLASNAAPHAIMVTYDQGDPNYMAPAMTKGNATGVAVLTTISTTAGATIPVQTIPVLNPTGSSGAVSYTAIACNITSGGFPVANTLCTPAPTAINNLAVGATFSLQISLGTKGASAQPAGTQAGLHLRGLESLGLVLPAILILPLGMSAETRKKLLRRRALTWLAIGLVLALMMMATSCGGGGFNNPSSLQPNSGASSATPVGSYIVQVTGTNQNGQTVVMSSIPLTVGF